MVIKFININHVTLWGASTGPPIAYSWGSMNRSAAMRRIWAIVVLWACYYTSNTRAQQCVADLFPPLPTQPSYSGLSPTYDAIGALNGWYSIAESFVDALWPDIPYGKTLAV